jgi:hypothetical protein
LSVSAKASQVYTDLWRSKRQFDGATPPRSSWKGLDSLASTKKLLHQYRALPVGEGNFNTSVIAIVEGQVVEVRAGSLIVVEGYRQPSARSRATGSTRSF